MDYLVSVCVNKDIFVFVIVYFFNYFEDKLSIIYAIVRVKMVCCHFTHYVATVSGVETHYFYCQTGI